MSTLDSEGSPSAVGSSHSAEKAGNSPPKSVPDIACNSCRKAKLRCSRDKPSCAHCRKTGLECLYESKRSKPGLKTGAIENVHRRLDVLERQAREQADSCRSAHTGTNVDTQENAAHEILGLLARELPKLVSGSNKTLPTRSLPAGGARQSSKRRRVHEDEDARRAFEVGGDSFPLLDAELLEETITAYFFNVHPWIPMIHEGRFRRRLEYEIEREKLAVVVQAMVVAASKFVPNASLPATTLAQTRSKVVATAMDNLCLESLQALIVIAYTDIGDGNAAKAWSIIGSLSRTVEYSQLAQEREDNEYQPLCQPFEVLDSTSDWTELEERRRIFWNVFNLDRFCSVAMSWSTSLTSADVHRRLPCDGHLWRKEQAVLTPYFGIWDKTAGRMGNPIGFIVEDDGPPAQTNGHPMADARVPRDVKPADMSNVGAFAYRIEATESMSRVVTYFLQQKVSMLDQQDISAWLTRFKELDLRLVHWKMLLPQKWKSNPNMTRPVPLMDPNLTLAHVTHNASMILLHQLIAYPPCHWPFRSRLPSSCSIEACYSAAIEITTITQRYIANSPQGIPIASQFGFCIFIAGRMLLVHWRSSPNNELPSEFWSLVQCLEEISRRWTGFSRVPSHDQNLSGKYVARLKELYISCARDEDFQIEVADYTNEITYQVKITCDPMRQRQEVPLRGTYIHSDIQVPKASDVQWPIQQGKTPASAETLRAMSMDVSNVDNLEHVEVNALPQMMLDQQFVNMDRIIAFDDGRMFASTMDTGMF